MAGKRESEDEYELLLADLEELVFEAEDAVNAAEQDAVAELLDHLNEVQGLAGAIIRRIIRGRQG